MLLDLGFPFVKYRYLVFIAIGGVPNPVDMAFSEVSGLSYSRDIVTKGNMVTLQNKDHMALRTLTLKRGVFGGMSPLTIAQVMQLPFFHEKLLRYDILISLVNGDGVPTASWAVGGAYLAKWSWDGLSGKANEVLTETMELKYSTLVYIPSPMRNQL
jgi:phage tail-like protein